MNWYKKSQNSFKYNFEEWLQSVKEAVEEWIQLGEITDVYELYDRLKMEYETLDPKYRSDYEKMQNIMYNIFMGKLNK